MSAFTTTRHSRTAQVHEHDADKPDLQGPGARHWLTRGAHFVIDYVELQPDATLVRGAADTPQPDEYLLLTIDVTVQVSAGGDACTVPHNHLVVVPPGASRVTAQGAGRLLRVTSARATDLLARAHNAAAYLHGGAGIGVAPFVPWPEPPGGHRLRVYDLAAAAVDGDKTRIFRSSNLMINVLLPRSAPRDVRQLSPHAHADFEQGSITLTGRWIHHLRTPWVPDMTRWHEDEHLEVGSPSVTLIPPTLVHTSRNVNNGPAWLIDVFAPPRLDFSRAGRVRNAADYPLMPEAQP